MSKKVILNLDCESKKFEGLDIEGRIEKISNLFEISPKTFSVEDVIVENYPLNSSNYVSNAHLLIEKRIEREEEEILYKIISVPSTTKDGERIFRNVKIATPQDKKFGGRVDYINFCKELSSFTTGHGHKDHIHGRVVGEMAYVYLMFMYEFLKENKDSGYDRLRNTLFEVVGKREGYFEQMLYGAMLHDIGKCLIPEEILNIRGKPSKKEINIIKMHPFYGELITRGIPGIEMSNYIARYHHEGWNGEGYEGLSGEEINLSSRITGFVDKVDALFSSRVYRKDRYSPQRVRDLFIGETSDERGNFCGILDPQIENLFFRDKITILEAGKRILMDTYKACFNDHIKVREREEILAA